MTRRDDREQQHCPECRRPTDRPEARSLVCATCLPAVRARVDLPGVLARIDQALAETP